MNNCRILFKKSGRAIYISHLDLMRTVTRAFIRAGIKIKHTEGFNPHPYMTFALPLSVCIESICELVDFVLINEINGSELISRLNSVLPEGITMLDAYTPERKFKDIQWMRIKGNLIYSDELPKSNELNSFFSRNSIIIPKKTKRGITDTDIKPYIKEIHCTDKNGFVELEAVVAAQNPSLNPQHLINALCVLSPEIAPLSSSFCRCEVYDNDMNIFR